MGYPTTDIFGDPGILLPKFYEPRTDKVAGRIGVIPHFVDYDKWLDAMPSDLYIVDVRRPVDMVVDDIASCEMTISSSLHGIIVSHAFGRKSAWMGAQQPLAGDGIKFLDYYEAGGVFDAMPYMVGPTNTSGDIVDIIELSPQPCVESLVEPLLQVCPFAR